jgi:hypothetical protein
MLMAAGTAGLLTLPMVGVSATPASGRATTTVASWQMNEAAGSTVMTDSSVNHLNGKIVASNQITTGVVFNGATGYRWLTRSPTAPPAQPERVIQVPDNDLLDITDPSVTYTLEFRYRTTHKYGNIMQKGQSTTKGGQIKVQNPGGTPQCLFKGANGVRVGTGSPVAFIDGQWHVVRCVKTATRVSEYVDGVLRATKNGSTGPINNASPWAVGGKTSCDQVTVTCDYYSGDIDYIKITRG